MSKKNTFYFAHDITAHEDEKIVSLCMDCGCEGYGVYWLILEYLANQSDYIGGINYNAVAYAIRSNAGMVKKVIENYGLFIIDYANGTFHSKRLRESMLQLDDVKLKRSEAGKKGADKKWKNNENGKTMANAIENDGKTIANANEKNGREEESKEKESKEKEKKEDALTSVGQRAHTCEADFANIVLEVWADHYLQKKGVRITPDFKHGTSDRFLIAQAVINRMKDQGYSSIDHDNFRQWLRDFLDLGYASDPYYQHTAWSLPLILSQFDRIYNNIINQHHNGKSTPNNRKNNGPNYSQEFLQRMADDLRD